MIFVMLGLQFNKYLNLSQIVKDPTRKIKYSLIVATYMHHLLFYHLLGNLVHSCVLVRK